MTASALDIAALEPWPACGGFGCGAWPTTLKSPLPTAHHTREFREKWSQVGDVSEEIEPNLYEVAHVEE